MDADERDDDLQAGSCLAASPMAYRVWLSSAVGGAGVLAAGADAAGRVSEDKALNLEDAEQVTQRVGVGRLVVASVQPGNHIIAGDLPQRGVSRPRRLPARRSAHSNP
jgi:hypothetical protein